MRSEFDSWSKLNVDTEDETIIQKRMQDAMVCGAGVVNVHMEVVVHAHRIS